MGYRFTTPPTTNKELGVMPEPALVGDSQDASGVAGFSTSSFGVRGDSDNLAGVSGTSVNNIGVVGVGGEIGVSAFSAHGTGVSGSSQDGDGVYGIATKGGSGVVGTATQPGSTGVIGIAGHIKGEGGAFYNLQVQGNYIQSGTAATFGGQLEVVGSISATGGKSFKIDHPLDPANKYLYHYSIESDGLKNIYDGEVKLDAAGTAVVQLPDWFESVNSNLRYQLTAIGAACPDLHIAQTVRNNRFSIAGGKKGITVSWQVIGTRSDPWAKANPVPVVETKRAEERGRYFYPHLYGENDNKPLRKTLSNKLLRQIERAVPELPASMPKPLSTRKRKRKTRG
jgi:hypothetical protein